MEVLRVDSYQKVVHTQNCQMLYDQKITYEFASRMSKYLIVHTNRRPDNFLQPHPINLLSHSRRQQYRSYSAYERIYGCGKECAQE